MGFDRPLDVFIGVSRGHEHPLELRWSEIDAEIEHMAEISCEHLQIGGARRIIVDHRLISEERADHRADAVDRTGDAECFGIGSKSLLQPRRLALEFLIDTRLPEQF